MADMTELQILFTGILVLLLAATIVAHVLDEVRPSPSVDNLIARINAWWIMVLALAIAFGLGRTAMVVLFAFASFNAMREFVTIAATRREDHLAVAAAFFIILPLQYYMIWMDWYGMFSIFIPVYAFLLMPIVAVLKGETEDFLVRIASVQWALMIAVYCVSYVPVFLSLEIPGFEGKNLLLIAFLILIVQLSDVLQYVWGKAIGRHKIAPRLSPSKTIEGFLGGVISATLIGAAMFWITPFTFWQAGLMALGISLMGFLGGLVMSAIKRDRGVKDWGDSIAGHGGFLDRLDSLVFAAPLFFHLTRFFWMTNL
ncbi:MAG: phosphatidate cytidylyltransferase [Rhodobacteraceae bacterium]|nr:phosphatidate cytidylyltransferase [Paracoccaceae bacterium]